MSARGDRPGAWVATTYGEGVRATLFDLLEFTESAERLVGRGRSAYDDDEALRLAAEAITHRVGEAANRLPEVFTTAHPEVEWRALTGMRNIVAHDYGRIDYEILWNALAQDFPKLAERIQHLLARG